MGEAEAQLVFNQAKLIVYTREWPYRVRTGKAELPMHPDVERWYVEIECDDPLKVAFYPMQRFWSTEAWRAFSERNGWDWRAHEGSSPTAATS
jgi:hypothetical protein